MSARLGGAESIRLALQDGPGDDLVAGALALLNDYVAAGSSDEILVCYAPDSRDQAALLLACADKVGIAHRAVPMLPLEDSGFYSRLGGALNSAFGQADTVRLITLERDTMSHSDVIRDLLRPFNERRYSVHRVMSSSDELFRIGLGAKPSDLEAVNEALLERLAAARRIRVTTPSGTDFEAELNSARYRWISNRGIARPGAMTILPAGEVATFPESIRGRFVADFAFNVNTVTYLDVGLRDRPVTFDIADGKASNFHCKDDALLSFILRNLDVPFGTRVGELGFGTNPCICEPLSHNSHLNERKQGVHLGLGQHNQSARSEYHCDVHLDLIADGGSIWIDNDPESINLLSPPRSSKPHRPDVMEEDVLSPYSVEYEGDCCGLDDCKL